MQAYRDLGSRNILEEGCNPLKKRPLVVSGHDTKVMMDLLEGELVGEGTSGVDAVRRGPRGMFVIISGYSLAP